MKIQHFSIIACAFALLTAGGLSSCSADYEEDFARKTLEVAHSDQANVVFQKEGGSTTIPVTTKNIDEGDWTASTDAPWLKIDKTADAVTMTAESYDGYLERQATVTIEYGAKQSYTIYVSQYGLDSRIDVPEQNGFFMRGDDAYGYFAGYESLVDVPISTNMNVDNIMVPDTVKWLTMTTDSTVDEKGLLHRTFTMQPNTTDEDRYCTLQFQSSGNWNKVRNVVIVQAATDNYIRPVYHDSLGNGTNVNLVDLAGNYRMPFQRTSADGEYTIEIPEDAKTWLTVDNSTVAGNEIGFKATLNTTDAPRSAEVTATPIDQSKAFHFTITQEAFQDVVPNGVENIVATPKQGAIGVSWSLPSFEKRNFTKIRVTATSASNPLITATKEVDATQSTVDVSPTYKFAGEYNIKVETVGARNKENVSIPTVTSTSNNWSETIPVKLTEAMLSSNSIQGDHGLKFAVDGSEDTYFQTNRQAGSDDKQPGRIDIHLETPVNGKFVIEFGQRKDNSTMDPISVRIFGSTDGSSWTELPSSPFTYRGNAGRRATLVNGYIDTQGKSYNYIRFQPRTRRNRQTGELDGTGNSAWDISELYFELYHDEAWAEQNVGK